MGEDVWVAMRVGGRCRLEYGMCVMETFCGGDSLLKSRTRVAYVLPASLLGVYMSTFPIVFGLMTERDTLRTSDQPPLLANELKEQG